MECVESAPSSGIPDELKRFRQWMGTRFAPRAGSPSKIDKPPYRTVAGKPIIKADYTTPEHWSTYDDALAALQRGDVDAIGFVFEDDPFFVVDLDGVVDPETGEIGKAAAQIIHKMDSYAELSCSGTGVHIIGTGRKPDFAGCRTQELGFEVEVYDKRRFLVVTGNTFRSTAPQERQGEIDELCRRLWPKPARFRADAQPPPTAQRARPLDIPDEELLERARRAKSGAKFRALYDRGDITTHAGEDKTHSGADFALIGMLIFWCAGDRERIIRLFEASALHRPNEKDRGYVTRSVDNALSSYGGSFYRPRGVKEAREKREDSDPLTPYLHLLLDPSAWGGRKGASAYKAYAGAVALAAERGIMDDDGNLRIGSDVRTLAEHAGAERTTLCRSALPYLIQDMKLVRWRRGRGRNAGEFVLLKPPADITDTTKVSTHLSGVSYVNAKTALETLRLLIRMRGGRSKRAKIPRLGMVAMFVTVALCSSTFRRGQSVAELAEHTGRRKVSVREACRRLVSADILEEVSEDVYRLTEGFDSEYERELEQSGVSYSERRQRQRHATDRAMRDEELRKKYGRTRGPTPSQRKAGATDSAAYENLKGSDAMRHTLEERGREARGRWVEEQRRKVGEGAATFLDDELRGISGARFRELRDRFATRGGNTAQLRDAVLYGPWEFKREEGGDLYIYWEGAADAPFVGPNRRNWEERMGGPQ